MATLNQNLNQFRQTAMKGQQDLTVNNNIKVVRINPAYAGTDPLVAGQAFKLVNVAGEVPIVEPAAVTEQAYGVAIHTMRKDTFLAGDYIELACKGSVVYLQTSAAVARGAKVQNAIATATVATLASLATNCQIGIMLDKPTAADQLARVEIDPQDPNLSAY